MPVEDTSITADDRRQARAAAADDRKQARAAAIEAAAAASPWMDLHAAAAYQHRPARWLAKQARAGLVRHARVGGKQQYVFRREWLDQHLEDQATPVLAPMRRRHG